MRRQTRYDLFSSIAAGSISGIDTIQEVADAHDATVYQIALAWLLEHSAVVLPILDTASLEHLVENVAAASISLSNEEYSRSATLDG